jgi:hypothetical protein
MTKVLLSSWLCAVEAVLDACTSTCYTSCYFMPGYRLSGMGDTGRSLDRLRRAARHCGDCSLNDGAGSGVLACVLVRDET